MIEDYEIGQKVRIWQGSYAGQYATVKLVGKFPGWLLLTVENPISDDRNGYWCFHNWLHGSPSHRKYCAMRPDLVKAMGESSER